MTMGTMVWGFIIIIAGSAFMAGALWGHGKGWRDARKLYDPHFR